MKVVLSLLVDNTAGVLSRIAGLFTRRGYNIDSITAGTTADPRFTRITIVTSGDHDIMEGKSVYRELMMIKVRANSQQRESITAVVNIFRASIVDVGKDSLTIMLTGDQSKLDALIGLLDDYEILELARTGVTGLSRGADDVRYFN